jgi:hypothetical protein
MRGDRNALSGATPKMSGTMIRRRLVTTRSYLAVP